MAHGLPGAARSRAWVVVLHAGQRGKATVSPANGVHAGRGRTGARRARHSWIVPGDTQRVAHRVPGATRAATRVVVLHTGHYGGVVESSYSVDAGSYCRTWAGSARSPKRIPSSVEGGRVRLPRAGSPRDITRKRHESCRQKQQRKPSPARHALQPQKTGAPRNQTLHESFSRHWCPPFSR
jgi:hypothetical protein